MVLVAAGVTAAPAGAAPPPFLSHFSTVTQIASTVPANGDVNPYGIANVPFSTGDLVRGDTLISNFNDELEPAGHRDHHHGDLTGRPGEPVRADRPRQPARGVPGGVGLTTALAVLNDGYVVVGSLPDTDGGTGTPEAGLPDRA